MIEATRPLGVRTAAPSPRRILMAGGALVFAGTFVWQFSGPNQTVRADSVLSFTFLQPLLRGAGRQVVMERLTVAERVLLANLREMERYRELFLTDVAFGTGSTGGPQRRGGFQGGAGLESRVLKPFLDFREGASVLLRRPNGLNVHDLNLVVSSFVRSSQHRCCSGRAC